jgi:hypothetical protein
MSDYRDPNDPMWRNTTYDPDTRGSGTSWGWIAAALFLVVVLAIVFGVKHEPTQTASNEPPASSRMTNPAAPPATPGQPSTPAPANR